MVTIAKEEKEISILEAARRLNVMPDHTYALVWANRLKARKVNRRWRVDAESVAARLKRLSGDKGTTE
jgi:excisionase family DNA binding protein